MVSLELRVKAPVDVSVGNPSLSPADESNLRFRDFRGATNSGPTVTGVGYEVEKEATYLWRALSMAD